MYTISVIIYSLNLTTITILRTSLKVYNRIRNFSILEEEVIHIIRSYSETN